MVKRDIIRNFIGHSSRRRKRMEYITIMAGLASNQHLDLRCCTWYQFVIGNVKAPQDLCFSLNLYVFLNGASLILPLLYLIKQQYTSFIIMTHHRGRRRRGQSISIYFTLWCRIWIFFDHFFFCDFFWFCYSTEISITLQNWQTGVFSRNLEFNNLRRDGVVSLFCIIPHSIPNNCNFTSRYANAISQAPSGDDYICVVPHFIEIYANPLPVSL